MLRLNFSLLALLIIVAPALAQSSGIQVLSARQISIDQAKQPHVESYIAVDPKDPQHLLATAMVLVNGEMRSYPYATFDGGKTWSKGQIIGDSSITGPGAADPIVYITNTGVCLFSTLSKVNGVSRTLVARSTDGGRTWPNTAILPNTDRQWLVVDSGRGPFTGRVYFTATGVYQSREGVRAVAPYLTRSDDDGLTFPFRSLVGYDRGSSNSVNPLNAVPMEPLVTPRGLLILTLQGAPDQQTMERAKRDSLNAWAFGLMVSDDGGDLFGPARYAPTARFSVTGNAQRRFRSTSAGGVVRTTIDTSSGRFANRIYFVSTDYDPKIDRYLVRVWYTADFGKTWGTAVASDSPRGDVANPAIAVSPDGIVAVIWNDRRDDPKGECWRLYASLSLDGGEHFLPAQRLSQPPTCSNVPENWQMSRSTFNSDQSGQYLAYFSTYPSVPTRFPMGGDTQGLVADATGVFHAAWINGETGMMQLWYTAFKIAPSLVAQLRSGTSPTTDASAVDKSEPAGMEEVTHEVRLVATKTNLDFTKRTYNVTIEMENQSARPLRGPFRAIMQHFLDDMDNAHGLKNLTVANADNGLRGVGAVWAFEAPSGILAPGARTKPRELLFTFEGGIPESPQGYLSPGFQVYGRAID